MIWADKTVADTASAEGAGAQRKSETMLHLRELHGGYRQATIRKYCPA